MPAPFGLTDLQAVGIVAGVLLSLVALVKVLIPAGRALSDVWSEFRGALAAFAGRDPFMDHATGRIVPAVPPLGKALADLRTETGQLRQEVSDLTSVVSQVADQQIEIVNLRQEVRQGFDNLNVRVGSHDEAIAALIATTFERGANSAMEAVRLDAAGQAEVIDVEGDE